METKVEESKVSLLTGDPVEEQVSHSLIIGFALLNYTL
jgi:hypothetical protein